MVSARLNADKWMFWIIKASFRYVGLLVQYSLYYPYFDIAAQCVNGGVCNLDISKPLCTCPVGFNGDRCQSTICPPNHCLNGGHCYVNSVKAPACSCPVGVSGVRCEVNRCSGSLLSIDCQSRLTIDRRLCHLIRFSMSHSLAVFSIYSNPSWILHIKSTQVWLVFCSAR